MHDPALALVTFAAGIASAVVTASLLVFAVALALSVMHGALELPAVRRRRIRRAAAKQRRLRCDRREHLLEVACVATYELEDLSLAVDQIAEVDEATALEVEPLLDRYVEVTRARKRCAAALSQADASRLELQLAIARENHPREAQVLQRRIEHTRVLADRLQRLETSAAELADLIRYYAERATLPDAEPLLECDTTASALAHYDAVEAAERTIRD